MTDAPWPHDEQAILAAARAALELDGLTAATTGELLRFGRLADSLDVAVFRVDRWDVTVWSATVLHADESSAVVEVDATVAAAATVVPGNDVTWETAFGGRIQLVRRPAGWKVADAVLDGHSLLESFFDLDQEASSGALIVRTVGGRISAPNVHLFLDFENGTGAPVALRAAAIALPRRWLGWRWRSAQLATGEVGTGTTRIGAAGAVEPLDVSRGVRLLVDSSAGTIDLGPPSAGRRRRLPWSLTRPLLNWVVLTLGLSLGLGVVGSVVVWLIFGDLSWIDGLTFVAIGVVTFSTSLLWGLIRKRHAFPGSQVPGYLVGIALLGAGLVVVVAGLGGSVGDVVDLVAFVFTDRTGIGLLLVGLAVGFIDHCPRALGKRRHGRVGWQVGAAGVAAVGFAVAFA